MKSGNSLVKLAVEMSWAKACTLLRVTRSVMITKAMLDAWGSIGCWRIEKIDTPLASAAVPTELQTRE